jgi:hypothetical protein
VVGSQTDKIGGCCIFIAIWQPPLLDPELSFKPLDFVESALVLFLGMTTPSLDALRERKRLVVVTVLKQWVWHVVVDFLPRCPEWRIQLPKHKKTKLTV